MSRAYLAAIGLLLILGLAACGEPGDEMPPQQQEPAPGALPPAD
jgi:hypothetical protein